MHRPILGTLQHTDVATSPLGSGRERTQSPAPGSCWVLGAWQSPRAAPLLEESSYPFLGGSAPTGRSSTAQAASPLPPSPGPSHPAAGLFSGFSLMLLYLG